ncbi:CapA family protein [Halorubrum sp. DTA98]|uniref:CapA family protein n=1 Tax=Halorubrum sp. DTA98 TaxID=3402163 RepID=UPI003AAB0C95
MSSQGNRPFTLAATGDSILTRSVVTREGDPRFNAILERLRDADATLTNLEAVVTDGSSYATPPQAIRDQYQYLAAFPGMVLRCPPALLDELTAMGIDLVSAASNHSRDFGRYGMRSTMRELEDRSIPYAGLGRNLPDARAPAYETTPGGRIGVVSACTSVAPESEAGAPSSLLPGRPGISPLHTNWTYRVTEERLDRIREIGRAVGIDDVRDTWRKQPDSMDETDDTYQFMHMTFESVDDEDDEGISHSLHPPDREAVIAGVREANATADWAVVSIHSHQGPSGTRNVPETPAMLESFARDCIDAGADAVIGSGPHVLRGIEVYDGKPIFYSLGNFFCQFETLDRLPAESFDYFGVEDDRYPSRVFDARYYEDGEPTGNLAYPDYWRTVVATCEFDDDGRIDRIELLPCSLGRTADRPDRGTPIRADDTEAESILDRLTALSEPYGTAIDRVDGIGVIDPS